MLCLRLALTQDFASFASSILEQLAAAPQVRRCLWPATCSGSLVLSARKCSVTFLQVYDTGLQLVQWLIGRCAFAVPRGCDA